MVHNGINLYSGYLAVGIFDPFVLACFPLHVFFSVCFCILFSFARMPCSQKPFVDGKLQEILLISQVIFH